MSKNLITISVTIHSPEGIELFRSFHTVAGAKPEAEGKFHFNSLIHPMELVLTEARAQFMPIPPFNDETATPGDDAIQS